MRFILPPFMYYFFEQMTTQGRTFPQKASIYDKLFRNTTHASTTATSSNVNAELSANPKQYMAHILINMPTIENNIVAAATWWALFTPLLLLDLVIFMPIAFVSDVYYRHRSFDEIPVIGPIFGLISSLLSFESSPGSTAPAERNGLVFFILLSPWTLISSKNDLDSRVSIPYFKSDDSYVVMNKPYHLLEHPELSLRNIAIAIPNLLIFIINSAITFVRTILAIVIAIVVRTITWLHHFTNLGVEEKKTGDDSNYIDNRLVTPLIYNSVAGQITARNAVTAFNNFAKFIFNTLIVMPLNLTASLLYTLPIVSANRAISSEAVSPKLGWTNAARSGKYRTDIFDDEDYPLKLLSPAYGRFERLTIDNVYLRKRSYDEDIFARLAKNTWRNTTTQILFAPINLLYMLLTPPEYREVLTKYDLWEYTKLSDNNVYQSANIEPGITGNEQTANAENVLHQPRRKLPSQQQVKGFLATFIAPLTGLPLIYSLCVRVYRVFEDAKIQVQHSASYYTHDCDVDQKYSSSIFSIARLLKNFYLIFIPFSTHDKLPRSVRTAPFSHTSTTANISTMSMRNPVHTTHSGLDNNNLASIMNNN